MGTGILAFCLPWDPVRFPQPAPSPTWDVLSHFSHSSGHIPKACTAYTVCRNTRRRVTFADRVIFTPLGHHNNHSYSSTPPGSQPTETLILTFPDQSLLIFFFRLICKHCCLLLKHPRCFSLNIFAPRFVTGVGNLGLF